MNLTSTLIAACALPGLLSSLRAAESTGSAFYGDPPDAHHPWAIHDHNRPQPPLVVPGTFSTQEQPGKPPSDAVILFDGSEAMLANWESDKEPSEPTKWIVKDGTLQCVPGSGYVRSKEKFGNCQLHVEWSAETPPVGDSQGRGNSGVFLMGKVEIQVLDNFQNPTYADGFASSVYGVNPPLANALQPPGAWQVYDIVFRRPIYKDGQQVDPGHVTVFCNGVLTQDHATLEGGTGHKSRSKPGPFPEVGPLKLQDHGHPVRYRNIWYRPLPPNSVEGGTDGPLSEEATTAKRKEIATAIVDDAVKLEGNARMLRLLESLTYQSDEAVVKQTEALAGAYVKQVSELPAAEQEAKKGEVMQLRDALTYLTKFHLLADEFPPKAEIDKLVKERGWDEKKKKK